MSIDNIVYKFEFDPLEYIRVQKHESTTTMKHMEIEIEVTKRIAKHERTECKKKYLFSDIITGRCKELNKLGDSTLVNHFTCVL